MPYTMLHSEEIQGQRIDLILMKTQDNLAADKEAVEDLSVDACHL